MRRSLAGLFLALNLTSAPAFGQRVNPTIDSLVQAVNIDSLVSYLDVLTGLDSLRVADSVQVYWEDSLENVHSSWYVDTVVALPPRVQMGNEVARYWLVEKLKSFGFDSVTVQALPGSPWMQNVWVEKAGTTRPDRVFILCAHYDAVPTSPGADDNGTGTAAVLEAARLLHDLETESTILFALWDAEEIGLVGSHYFAQEARDSGREIGGVFNLDMIGWDGDKDRVTEIHADEPSTWLADVVYSVTKDYDLNLWPVVHEPGTRRSDHASFWDVEYPAVLGIEELFSQDFNPYYHSEDDKLENLDLSYFLENARLAVAAIGTLAGNSSAVATEPTDDDLSFHAGPTNWPNPFSSATRITFWADAGPATIGIFDVNGRRVSTIERFAARPGRQTVTWNPSEKLANGAFVYRITTASGSMNGMMVLSR